MVVIDDLKSCHSVAPHDTLTCKRVQLQTFYHGFEHTKLKNSLPSSLQSRCMCKVVRKVVTIPKTQWQGLMTIHEAAIATGDMAALLFVGVAYKISNATFYRE